MSKTYTIKINCDTEAARNSVMEFFEMSKASIVPMLQKLINGSGESSDPELTLNEDGTITINQVAENKGKVITADGDTAVVVDYSDVAIGGYYSTLASGVMAVYEKVDSDADVQVGYFKTLDETLKSITSDQFKAAVEKARAPKAEMVVEDAEEVESE